MLWPLRLSGVASRPPARETPDEDGGGDQATNGHSRSLPFGRTDPGTQMPVQGDGPLPVAADVRLDTGRHLWSRSKLRFCLRRRVDKWWRGRPADDDWPLRWTSQDRAKERPDLGACRHLVPVRRGIQAKRPIIGSAPDRIPQRFISETDFGKPPEGMRPKHAAFPGKRLCNCLAGRRRRESQHLIIGRPRFDCAGQRALPDCSV